MERFGSGPRGGRTRLVGGVALAAALVVGPVVAGDVRPASAAPAPLVATVSELEPYDDETVTITVTGLGANTDYGIHYLVALEGHFDPYDADNTISFKTIDAGFATDGSGVLTFVFDWTFDLDGGDGGGDDAFILPGRIVITPDTEDPDDATGLDDFVAVSAQMFPGRGFNGDPSFTITGAGFVDGAFVPGESIAVEATGFPAGTLLAQAVAWVPTSPSTGDVSTDFWRDYLNCALGDGTLADGTTAVSCPLGPGTAGFSAFPGGEELAGTGTAPVEGMAVWLYHFGVNGDGNPFFGYDVLSLEGLLATVEGARTGTSEGPAEDPVASTLALSCQPQQLVPGTVVTCTVTGGDPGIVILWRAAYNPVFAEAGVTLGAAGTGTFSFVVPAAAIGQDVTVELAEWLAPVTVGVVGGPVPTSVPSGGGPVPVGALLVLALAGGALLRRMSLVGVRG